MHCCSLVFWVAQKLIGLITNNMLRRNSGRPLLNGFVWWEVEVAVVDKGPICSRLERRRTEKRSCLPLLELNFTLDIVHYN